MVRKPPPPVVAESADDVEALFYDALSSGDLAQMMALWADDDEIVCVHPSGERCVGPAAVRHSFEAILAHGGMPVQPEQVHRLHTMDSAVHHLVECIRADGAQAWMLATNVYVRTPAGWRMVAHHASPVQGHQLPQAGEAPSTLH